MSLGRVKLPILVSQAVVSLDPPSITSLQPIANSSSSFLDTRPSGLAINLSSNNPFRNRTASPTYPAATQYSPSEAPPRPVSRNPFLDTSSSANTNSFPIQHSQIPSPAMGFPAAANAMPSPALTGNAADLFVRHIPLHATATRPPLMSSLAFTQKPPRFLCGGHAFADIHDEERIVP